MDNTQFLTKSLVELKDNTIVLDCALVIQKVERLENCSNTDVVSFPILVSLKMVSMILSYFHFFFNTIQYGECSQDWLLYIWVWCASYSWGIFYHSVESHLHQTQQRWQASWIICWLKLRLCLIRPSFVASLFFSYQLLKVLHFKIYFDHYDTMGDNLNNYSKLPRQLDWRFGLGLILGGQTHSCTYWHVKTSLPPNVLCSIFHTNSKDAPETYWTWTVLYAKYPTLGQKSGWFKG